MAAKAEVIVVGAGVTGLATAHALAEQGREVLVIEQFRLGHTRGSSHGASRIFRLAYPDVRWVRLAQRALAGWRSLEAESGETLLELPGLLELVRDPAQSSRAALEESGVRCEVLEADEVADRFGISVPAGMNALFQPEAGIVYAERAQHALLDAARRRGVRLLEETRVDSLDELEAETVVVTAGAWARRLLATAGIELPVVVSRETVAYFELERPVPSVVAEITNGHGYYALADPAHGLKAGHHHTGAPADPDHPGSPDAETAARVAAWAAERFGLADPTPAALDTCLYTNTADESFVVERHGRIVVGSACSGHGFKFAPAVGEQLAALAAG